MLSKPTADQFVVLIGKRQDATGLQDAHMISRKLHRDNAWIQALIEIEIEDEPINFLALPESERGSAILGVSAHFGGPSNSVDKFFYIDKADSRKFLDVLKTKLDLELISESQAKIELRNFIDFTKILYFYDSLQDDLGLIEADRPTSIILNISDPRVSNRSDTISYYDDEILPELLDDEFVRNHPFYQKVSEQRQRYGQDSVTNEWLVDNFPQLS